MVKTYMAISKKRKTGMVRMDIYQNYTKALYLPKQLFMKGKSIEDMGYNEAINRKGQAKLLPQGGTYSKTKKRTRELKTKSMKLGKND